MQSKLEELTTMAHYYWLPATAESDLSKYRLEGKLLDRAKTLLAEGNEIEIGEMWYGGKMHYRLRYSPRIDYSLREDDMPILHIEQNGSQFWVMGYGGSVHSSPFISLQSAEEYLQRRLRERS